MFGLSAGEILLIALIALVLFGNEKLPQNIKKFLKGWHQSKKTLGEFQRSWHDIKLDLKNNVEFLDEKHAFLNENETQVGEKSGALVSPQPAIYAVSQDEIDAYDPSADTPTSPILEPPVSLKN